MSIIKIGKADVVWSYLGTFFRLGVNILILPLVLHFLTDDELGLWYVFSSISALAALLDFGFAPALSRNISYVWCGAKELKKNNVAIVSDNKTDFVYLKTVLQTCRYIYLAIATAALLLLLSVGTLYIYKIGGEAAIISWVIYCAAVFINMLYSYFTSFLRGIGAIAENNKAAVISRAVQVLLTVPLLLLGYGLLGVSIAYFLSGLALRLYSRYAFNKYEGIGEQIKSVVITDSLRKSWGLFRTIWYNASKDGLVTFANYLSTHANTLISSALISLSMTGSYGIAVQFANVIYALAVVPFTANHPLMQEKAITGDKKENMHLLSTSIFLYTVTFVTLSILFVLCKPLILILKPGFSLDTGMLLCVAFYYFIYYLYCLFASFISTYNTLPYTKAFIISSFVSVGLSFLMVKLFEMGIWALIMAPIIVTVTYNLWKWPTFVLNRLLHVSFYEFVQDGAHGALEYYKKYLNLNSRHSVSD